MPLQVGVSPLCMKRFRLNRLVIRRLKYQLNIRILEIYSHWGSIEMPQIIT